MAIDPRISLLGRGVDLARSAQTGLNVRDTFDRMRLAAEQAPVENKLLQAQADQAQQAATTQSKNARIGSIALGAAEILPDIQAGNAQGVQAKLQRRRERLISEGKPTNDTDEALALLSQPDGLARLGQISQQAVQLGQQVGALQAPSGGAGTEERFFDHLTESLTPEQREEAGLIRLGLAPRATGSAALTIAEGGLTDIVGESEAAIAGRKAATTETARLAAQLKLEPKVRAQVTEAVAMAKEQADINIDQRSAQKALSVYETAMSGLSEALSDTATGPFAGYLPAITANQQIADGAIAALAPVLKQMFRSAGEGNFTDSDQKILMAMVPTRKDSPEARVAKMANIDAIVRAKLSDNGAPQQASPQGQAQAAPQHQTQAPALRGAGVIMTDANGNRARVFEDGSFEEL